MCTLQLSPLGRPAATLLVIATLGLGQLRAADSDSAPQRHALLDVPFVAQTPELCGGAAVAMVLRYWGERGVVPQDFATLVSASDGGIFTGTLAAAVRARGWLALVDPATHESPRTRLRAGIDAGRPVIALIEVSPRTYHYVVMVGATDREVVLHDPARAPFRVLGWAEFDRAWAPAGRWMMVVLPSAGVLAGDGLAVPDPAPREIAARSGPTPCDALVDRGVDMALSGDPDGAERDLLAATGLCPASAAPWRELAGLRFSQSRWSDAEAMAARAAAIAPDDAHAWQLLATSRYMRRNVSGALGAWNRAGEPRVDTVAILGAARTPHPVIVRASALRSGQLLTPQTLARADRRLRDLPVASNARARYVPIDGGLARIDVVIDERPVLPTGWLTLATMGGRALLFSEARLDVAGSLGAGEVMSVAARWSPARPLVGFALAFPTPEWIPGNASFELFWERQSYSVAPSSSATLRRESRRRVAAHLSDWATNWLRWRAGGALDRFIAPDPRSPRPDHLSVEGSLDARAAGDRLALNVAGGWWLPLGDGVRFATGDVSAAWRSTVDARRPVWSALTAMRVASDVAPLALWPGAGTGQGRPGLLRAHPLLLDDVVTGAVFGRHVVNGSIEHARPIAPTLGGGLALAGFIDTARAWHRTTSPVPSRLFVDAGIGIRLRVPGSGGAVRLDVAHGLRGGGTTVSASWGAAWPK